MVKKNLIYKCLQVQCPPLTSQKSHGNVTDILSHTFSCTADVDIIALGFHGYLRVHH